MIEKVLIGGGISSDKEFMADLETAILDVFEHTLDKTGLDVCKFLNNAGSLGAIYLVKLKEANNGL